MIKPKPYRISDGNGGHLWDWKNIKETVIGGLILAIIISVTTTALNRVFNVQRLEQSMKRVEAYSIRSLQMNNIQNDQINTNTELIYRKYFPGVPPPKCQWPESEVKP